MPIGLKAMRVLAPRVFAPISHEACPSTRFVVGQATFQATSKQGPFCLYDLNNMKDAALTADIFYHTPIRALQGLPVVIMRVWYETTDEKMLWWKGMELRPGGIRCNRPIGLCMCFPRTILASRIVPINQVHAPPHILERRRR